MEALKRFIRDEEGLAMAEYALLLALIAVLVAAAIGSFKDAIIGAFSEATGALSGPGPS